MFSGSPNAVGPTANAWEFGAQRCLQDGLPREVPSGGQNLDVSQGTDREGGAGVGEQSADVRMCVSIKDIAGCFVPRPRHRIPS